MTDQIDPKVTEADAKYLKMTPKERQIHLASQGHAFPTERTDEDVMKWFEAHPVLRQRLALAQALNRKK